MAGLIRDSISWLSMMLIALSWKILKFVLSSYQWLRIWKETLKGYVLGVGV
jgi:hypothetical protein